MRAEKASKGGALLAQKPGNELPIATVAELVRVRLALAHPNFDEFGDVNDSATRVGRLGAKNADISGGNKSFRFHEIAAF
jgi:hypothetical protein